MGRIFDPQNPFFRRLGSLVDLMGLSLLWLVCSLPAVTAGAASSAMYIAVLRCVLPGESGAFRTYFAALRDNLKSGVAAMLAVLAAVAPAAYLMLHFYAWYKDGYMGGLLLETALGVALLLPAGALCVMFPLAARFSFTLGRLISVSFRIALGHFPVCLLLTALAALSVWLSVAFWAPVLILPALWSLAAARLLEPVFLSYSNGP